MPLLAAGRVVVVSMVTVKQPTCAAFACFSGAQRVLMTARQDVICIRRSDYAVERTEIGKTRGVGR